MTKNQQNSEFVIKFCRPVKMFIISKNNRPRYHNPNVRGGQVFLNTGDVWKYGETTRNPPEKRYGGIDKLHNKGLEMHYDFRGTQKQIKREEKRKLYFYFFNYQHLPPGNSIFR